MCRDWKGRKKHRDGERIEREKRKGRLHVNVCLCKTGEQVKSQHLYVRQVFIKGTIHVHGGVLVFRLFIKLFPDDAVYCYLSLYLLKTLYIANRR